MIIFNPGKLPDGAYIAHLHIEIPHAKGKLQFVRSEICSSPTLVSQLEFDWLTKWIRTELRRFVNQRENALKVAGYLPMNQRAFHIILRKVLTQTKYLPLCAAIDQHQDALRQILPGPDSPQSSWIRIIDEIIHHAHHTVHK